MKRLICSLGFALILTFVACARAGEITVSYSGTINSVYDHNNISASIDFTPIPSGSLFSGTFTYNSSAPQTGGGEGYALYYDLTPSSASVTINGFSFMTMQPGFANPALQVISEESGLGISGISTGTQPLSLPINWDVANGSLPYFTLWFFDQTAQSRSLELPTVASDFPVGSDIFNLGFQQPVTVDGETYGGSVFVTGDITSFMVTAVPEPGTVAMIATGLPLGLGFWCWKRRR